MLAVNVDVDVYVDGGAIASGDRTADVVAVRPRRDGGAAESQSGLGEEVAGEGEVDAGWARGAGGGAFGAADQAG